MLFNSATFVIFFIFVYGAYLLLRKQLRLQNLLLLVSSYIFYGWWDERFLILIAISTTADYLTALGVHGDPITKKDAFKSLGFLVPLSIGLAIPDWENSWYVAVGGLGFVILGLIVVFLFNRLEQSKRRKAFVVASIVANLGILGFFKYFNFFAESLSASAELIGVKLDYATLHIILPVGISFYTFQTLSYTLDVWRREIEPTRHFLEHAAFVSFFPQLVAGPIERAKNLLPQFMKPRKITREAINSGIALFLWGLFKKVVIADNLAPIANQIFSNPSAHSSGGIIVGVLAFTFQIFCDFSGYSDMARALARVMGFELMLNFNIPYISRTPSEFWRRWHISLSSWLRDYLYISLGGNRGSEWKTYRNLMLTMLLGGLWHGAAWTFVAWGAYQGLILVIYRLLRVDEKLKTINSSSVIGIFSNTMAWTVMFVLTMIGWIFFRATSFTDVQEIFSGILSFSGLSTPLWHDLFIYLWPLLLVQFFQLTLGKLEIFHQAPVAIRFNVILFCLMGLLLLSAPGGQEFIYFDF